MIRHNLGYKLMALGVALALWSYVNTELNPQASRTFTVPLEVTHVAAGHVADPDVRDVSVTVRGTKSVVDAVNREDVVAAVSLAGVGKDDESTSVVSVKVQSRVRDTAGDLDISVIPEKLKVRVEALGDARLPVEVKFPAVPPLGFAYTNTVITPASVRISGKVSEVARVKRVVLTLPSRIPSGSIDDSFPVTPIDSKGVPVTGLKMDANSVRLRLELVEVPATKTVIVSPDVTGVPAFPAKVTRVSVSPALVTLQGRPGALANITTIDTDHIAVDGATTTITRDVDLRVPAGVTTTARSRVKVTVYISAPEQ